jgi:hypothetical protein
MRVMIQNTTNTDLTVLEESVVGGLARLLPDASVPIAGKLIGSKELQARVKAHADILNALRDAHAKVSELVALDQSMRGEMAQLLMGIRNQVSALYGEESAAFASFGFKARKTPQRTPKSKVVAAEKSLATRAARHTMGKRQRSQIHGTVPAAPDAPTANGAPAGSKA